MNATVDGTATPRQKTARWLLALLRVYDWPHMGSDFLFAMPSTLSGISRTLDLGGTFDSYNESSTGLEADAKALFADWNSVGDSLVRAIEVFKQDEPDGAPRVLELVKK